MRLPRKVILMVASLGAAYALVVPMASPGLDSIESAAPAYFDALTKVPMPQEPDSGMSALRERAGSALSELQTRRAR